jgi:uncharacterized protein (DUF885 family)
MIRQSALFALMALLCSFAAAADPAELRTLAHEYYQWRDAAYPVATSAAGDHRFDDRLTDYRMAEVMRRRQHVSELLETVKGLQTEGWSKEDQIDRILFQAQLEGADFFGRRLSPEGSDPQVYVNECSGSIFTLLQKDYAPHRTRAGCYEAPRANAGVVARGSRESHPAGEAVRNPGDPGRARRG